MAADATEAPEETGTTADRRARVELLEAENRALRDELSRRHRTRYRRSALGMAALGVAAGLAAVIFPDARSVLFALAATGLFGGLLTYYLAPERFVSADVGAAAFEAHADAVDAVVDELGLAGDRVYLPRDSETDPVRLFLPQHAEYALPAEADLTSFFVVTEEPDERGVSVPPTGVPLLRELRRTLSGPLADDPGALADQLTDGLVEAFELVDRATPEVETGRVTVGVAGAAFGDATRIDHPVASLLAVGFAAGLGRPIAIEAAAVEDDRADVLLTCRWIADEGSAPSSE